MVAPKRFEVVAIGCSAGGLQALAEVLGGLPRNFPAAVLIVQHLHPTRKNRMAEVVARLTALPVLDAVHDEPLLPGRVYLAPADEHLEVRDAHVRLSQAEPVRFSRPSVDTLFQSVAREYGPRAIGLILSGSLRDGAEGVRAMKEAGATTAAELPEDAEFQSMPEAAIATGCVDHVLPLAELAPWLTRLCTGAAAAQ